MTDSITVEEASLWLELPADLHQAFEQLSKAYVEWVEAPQDQRHGPSFQCVLRLPEELLHRELELIARLLGRYDPVLRALEFSCRRINNHAATLLARGLVRNQSLCRLQLYGNQLGDEGVRALVSSLVHSNTALEELDLGANNLTSQSGPLLALLLTHHRGRLAALRLDSNALGSVGATAIVQALHADSPLAELRLAQNHLGPDIADFSGSLGASGSSLSVLHLGNNGLGATGVDSLLRALLPFASLTTLDISSNAIGAEGARAVAQYLAQEGSVRSLLVNFNGFYRDSIAEIINSAFFSPNLTRLELIGHDMFGGNSLLLVLSDLLQRNFANQELRSTCLLETLLPLA